jgi:hypothetical protein
MKHLALIVALAAFSTSAFAEGGYQDGNELRLVRSVMVSVWDEVKDGCLSNPNALKVEAELILRRSDVGVSEEPLDYRLGITTSGWEIISSRQPTGTCMAMVEVSLWRYAKVPEGHWAFVTAYTTTYLMLGSTKASTQETFHARVSEYVSDLANEILKAQGK